MNSKQITVDVSSAVSSEFIDLFSQVVLTKNQVHDLLESTCEQNVALTCSFTQSPLKVDTCFGYASMRRFLARSD